MAKPKKKSMTIRLGSDAVTVLDVVKQAISKNDFGYIDSQAQFIEILIMNYAYQVLNDIDTFTKRQSMVKQALSDKEIEMYKYVDVTTPNGYGCVKLDNDVNELEQKLEEEKAFLKDVKDALERKGKRRREIKEEIEELERQKTELESDNYAKGINNTSNQNIAKNRAGNNATSDIFDNKNRNGKEKNSRGRYHMKDKPRKERKDKVKAPEVDVINLVKDNDTLVRIDRKSFEQYILNYAKNEDGMTDEESKSYLKSLNYKGNDNKLKVSVNVFLELENMASEYANERVQLVSKASNYTDEIERTKTEKDGIVFADIEVETNKTIREFEEKRQREKEKFERHLEERKRQHEESQSGITPTTTETTETKPLSKADEIYNSEIETAIPLDVAIKNRQPKISKSLYLLIYDVVIYQDGLEKKRIEYRKMENEDDVEVIVASNRMEYDISELTREKAEQVMKRISRDLTKGKDENYLKDYFEVNEEEDDAVDVVDTILSSILENKIPEFDLDFETESEW